MAIPVLVWSLGLALVLLFPFKTASGEDRAAQPANAEQPATQPWRILIRPAGAESGRMVAVPRSQQPGWAAQLESAAAQRPAPKVLQQGPQLIANLAGDVVAASADAADAPPSGDLPAPPTSPPVGTPPRELPPGQAANAEPLPREPALTAPAGAPRMLTYQQAYDSIPFSRAEYEANPGYRHDAALELVFGTMRPTTIVRQTIPYFSRYPDMFRYRYTVFPYPNRGGGALNAGVFFSPVPPN